MYTLLRINDSDNFIGFDTEITPKDKQTIENEFKEIITEHPTWDWYDCIGELLEERCIKYGLNGTFLRIDGKLNFKKD